MSARRAISSPTSHGKLVPESMPPEGERGHPFELDGLTWRIHAVLDDLPTAGKTAETYARVRAYLERAADEGEEGSGTMALASRLARLYDDYQLYRTEALAAWASGGTAARGWPDEPWQADLWRYLVSTAPDNRHGRVIDRATSLRPPRDRARGAGRRRPRRGAQARRPRQPRRDDRRAAAVLAHAPRRRAPRAGDGLRRRRRARGRPVRRLWRATRTRSSATSPGSRATGWRC